MSFTGRKVIGRDVIDTDYDGNPIYRERIENWRDGKIVQRTSRLVDQHGKLYRPFRLRIDPVPA